MSTFRTLLRLCVVLGMTFIFLPCAAVAAPPGMIPRSVLFGNPVRILPQLAPDGQRYGFLAIENGAPNLWICEVDTMNPRALTHNAAPGIRQFVWAEDNTHILYTQNLLGKDNWRLYALDLATGASRDISGIDSGNVRILGTSPRFPDNVLVAVSTTLKPASHAYNITISTGKAVRVAENPGDVAAWIADYDMNIRAAIAHEPGGITRLDVRDASASPWRTLATWTVEDGFGSIYGFSPDGKAVYVSDTREANALRLISIELAGGKRTVVAADSIYDVSGITTNPETNRIEAVSFARGRNEWQVIDSSIARDLFTLSLLRGDYTITSRNRNDSLWLVGFAVDNSSPPYYLYNRHTGQTAPLFTVRPALDPYRLASMQPVTFSARDGLILHGYLTLPHTVEPENLPLVVLVHGGPWTRDSWGYNPEVQWLANRGYACLQVNFRGSTGYGKKFLEAGNREWGAKMLDDVVDGVRWAVEQGIVDSSRVAIYGSSFGGYMALSAAVSYPDLFRCAVDVMGFNNLTKLLNSIGPKNVATQKVYFERVGNPGTEQAFLDARSPLRQAAKIRVPLLITQGARDPRVDMDETQSLVDTVKGNGVEVVYFLFSDEGHGITRADNREKFQAAVEKFLAHYLGGQVEE